MPAANRTRRGFRNSVKPDNTKKVYWDDPLKGNLIQFSEASRTVRAGPYLVNVKTHYIGVRTANGDTGFTKLCVKYDPRTGEDRLDDNGEPLVCPYCEFEVWKKSKKTEKGADPFYKGRAWYASDNYYTLAIDRAVQRKTKEDKFLPCRMTKGLAQDIREMSAMKFTLDNYSEEELEEMGIDLNDPDTLPDATDEEFGYDFTVKKEENDNKTTYKADSGKVKALTESELAAFEEAVAIWDIAKMADKAETPKEAAAVIASLVKRGSLIDRNTKAPLKVVEAEEADDDDDSEAEQSKARGKNRMKIPDDDALEERSSLTGGDDDDDDDGTGYDVDDAEADADDAAEEPAPAPKPAAKVEKKKPATPPAAPPKVEKKKKEEKLPETLYDIDDDDDDDDLVRSGAEPDEDAPDLDDDD